MAVALETHVTQAYCGFTPDGERVLKRAHIILDNWTAMQQDIAQRRDGQRALRGHPDVEVTILSHSSIDILRHLEEFRIDVGAKQPLCLLTPDMISPLVTAAFACAKAIEPNAVQSSVGRSTLSMTSTGTGARAGSLQMKKANLKVRLYEKGCRGRSSDRPASYFAS